jgi:hypothetical protein
VVIAIDIMIDMIDVAVEEVVTIGECIRSIDGPRPTMRLLMVTAKRDKTDLTVSHESRSECYSKREGKTA